jgi:hypothetical protein
VQSAGGDHRDLHGFHGLGDQRQRPDETCVAAALAALADYGVAAGLLGLDRVLHRPADDHDLQPGRLQAFDDRQGHAQTRDEGARRPFLDDDFDAGGQGVGRGGQQVDAERLVGERADLVHLAGG